jgi:PAS domain S-box-containing protein
MLDLNGHVVSWNSGAVRLKGYSEEEIIGQSFARFYTPEDLQAGVPQKALRVARETGRFEAEGWRVRKDGSRFWASVVIDAVRDQRGETIGFAKVTRDVTERQRAHQSLVESEARYWRLVEGVTDYAIFQLDPTGLVTSWNPGAQRIKGYTRDEIVGKHFSAFYTEEDVETKLPERALRTAVETGKYDAEGWRLRKDGSKFWASIVIDAGLAKSLEHTPAR